MLVPTIAQVSQPHTPGQPVQNPSVPGISDPWVLLAIVTGAAWALFKSMMAASEKRNEAIIKIMTENQKENHLVLLKLIEQLDDKTRFGNHGDGKP